MNRNPMSGFGIAVLVMLGVMLIGLEIFFRSSTTAAAPMDHDTSPTLLDDVVYSVKTAVPEIRFEVVETAVPAIQQTRDCAEHASSNDDYWVDVCGGVHPWRPVTDHDDYVTRAAEYGVTPQPKPTEASNKPTNFEEVKSGKEIVGEAAAGDTRNGRNETSSHVDVPYAMLFGRDEKKDAKCQGNPQQFLEFFYQGEAVPHGWFDACGNVHDGVMPADVKTEKNK